MAKKIVKTKTGSKNKSVKPAARKKPAPIKSAKKAPVRSSKPAVRPVMKKTAVKPAPARKSAKGGTPPKKSTKPRGGSYAGISEALLRLRESITGQINFLATDNLTRTQNDAEVDFRSEEQGTDNYDRDFALTRVSSDQNILFEIDEALNRLELGTYGQCESCGCAIEKARMKALPYSRMCVACQTRSEANTKRMRSVDSSSFLNAIEKNQPEPSAEDE